MFLGLSRLTLKSMIDEQPASVVVEEAPVVEAAPATEEKKYDFDVDFEI